MYERFESLFFGIIFFGDMVWLSQIQNSDSYNRNIYTLSATKNH